MNIVNKLTLRQLKLNKKRTLVTIIGTIISAAMITAVATLGLSFMDLMQRQSIASDGEWHAKYTNINSDQLERIASEKEIKTVILSRDIGYSYLEGSQNNNKPYLYIKEFSKEGYENFPVDLVEGRLPEAPYELVISEAVRTNARVDINIGDTIELAIGHRISTLEDTKHIKLEQNYALHWKEDTIAEYLSKDLNKSYTIVGMIKRPDWEYTWSPGYTALSYVGKDSIHLEELFDVSVVFKKIDNKLFDKAQRIGTNYDITEPVFNYNLLRYYGVYGDDGVKKMLYGLSAIIMVIIVIGSISLIYNAFAISVSERSRYLGMLSSVGATKKQKRNSVLFEGAVIGFISIPIGILSGYIGLGVTYIFINPLIINALNVTSGFRLVIVPSSLITSVLVSSITILISAYIPARRASNITAIDAIRQTTDYKIRGKQVRTLRLTRIFFGIEADLGLKNLKRNKGRYKATVFSLIISMVLFLVVSSFTMYLKKALVLTQDGINFDIKATVVADDKLGRMDIVQKIISQENITNSTVITNLYATTMIQESAIADYLEQGKEAYLVGDKYPYQVTINILEEEELLEYAKELGLAISSLTTSDIPTAILIDTIRYKDQVTDKYVEAKAIDTEEGKLLELSLIHSQTGDDVALPSIKIAALTGKLPMGVMQMGKSAGFHIIMSQTSFERMILDVDIDALTYLSTAVYMNSDKPLKLQEKLEVIQNEVGQSKLYLYNLYYYKQQEEQMLILMSVFTYAFILLITAICIANIINTISTSIALRKREFAMLKSVGITPNGFNKMLNYESIFYGIKALVYGLPISFLTMYLMHRLLMSNFEFEFEIPMISVFIVIVSVFVIVGLAMLYSGSKVKKENIIDALKQEIA